jgi:glutaredoxin
MPIELFATKTCPYCSQAREQLELDGLDYIEFDVESDAAALARLTALIGGNPMVPVLVEDGCVTQVGVAGRGCYVGNG